jgi:hypothetical protein
MSASQNDDIIDLDNIPSDAEAEHLSNLRQHQREADSEIEEIANQLDAMTKELDAGKQKKRTFDLAENFNR